MSFFTTFLETTPHFGLAIEQIETELKLITKPNYEQLNLLVKLAYSYAHVQLQKGVATADKAIALSESLNNHSMKANALCAKAMNEVRIGYIEKAKANALLALTIFEILNDEAGKSDAHFQLGTMIHLSVGPGDTPIHLQQALKGYTALNNTTGVFLVRIQQNLLPLFQMKVDEVLSQYEIILSELQQPHQNHLQCFVFMQKSCALYFKQDIPQLTATMQRWQPLAQTNGNFHDVTMTKSMLTDCYRIQQLNKEVMQVCIESITCCEQLGSFHGKSTTALVMANICFEQNQYQDALHYYQAANEAAIEIQDPYKHHYALNGIGLSFLKTGKFEQAHETFQTVLAKATAVQDKINSIAAHRNIAELAIEQGNYDLAFQSFKNLFNTATADSLQVQDYGKYAFCIGKATNEILEQAGIKPRERHTLILHYLEKHLALAQQQKSQREEANACNALAEYYEHTNDLTQALNYRKTYISLYENLVNEQSISSIASLRLQYEAEKKDHQIILLKKENEETLLRERLRISRDLHDDMGATLSSISVYGEAVKQRIQQNRLYEAENLLNRISEDAREMVSNMSDTVWMLKLQNDSMEKLIERLHNYANNTLTSKNIQLNFICSEEIKQQEFTIEQRKNIYLLMKEAINNAAKYAEAEEVSIRFEKEKETLYINITDNGKGFDKETAPLQGGNGLKNMKERAKALEAELTIQSKHGEGTVVEVVMNGR